MKKEELEFCEEWLMLKQYSFKLLTALTVLADNKRAFRGTLADICDCIGIQPSSSNKERIKLNLAILQEQELVKVIVDKDIYTVSLAAAAQKSKNIIKIKKAWYILLKDVHANTKTETSFENLLKVFLKLLELSPSQTYTYTAIGKMVNLSKSTVGRCVKVLSKIDFEDFRFCITVDKVQKVNGQYHTKGQIYNQMIQFK